MLKVAIFATLVAISAAHVCMISPPQRGTLGNINKVAAKSCYLYTAPCGGVGEGNSSLILKANQKFTAVVQKNLDHFNTPAPGRFSFFFGHSDSLQLIGTTPDDSQPSLALYYTTVTIPDVSPGKYILQVQYITQHPGSGIFYNCADVTIA